MCFNAPNLVELEAQLAKKEEQITALTSRCHWLEEQLRLLRAKRFGPSSEVLYPEQTLLFNEAEVEAPNAPEAPPAVVVVPAHQRAKGGRRPLPPELPRVEIVHDLPREAKTCAEDGHTLVEIGIEISEQLDIIPAKVQVLRHIRKKYVCPHCQQGVKTAPLPPQPLPKSLASPGLAAYVAVAKYQDGLPLYRQAAILLRSGIDLPRATLALWMVRLGHLLQPVINLLRDQLLGYDIVQMDETPVQVLTEPGKTAQSTSYMWVQRGGPPDRAVILFDYDSSRAKTVPLTLLAGFRGYLQCDGYEGYNAIGHTPGVILVGCMAHARRKFAEAVKAQGQTPAKASKALQGLLQIQALYQIERTIRDASPDIRFQTRQELARPLLDKLQAWLIDALPQIPPQSLTGKALGYLQQQWPKLLRYLDDGRLAIDNNATENSIRPFVTGRKNWLFSDSVKGANASANLYSVIETAKANGHEPYAYLRHLFTELPKATTVEQIEALLPFHLSPEEIRRSLIAAIDGVN